MAEGIYQLTGNEKKVELVEKCPCGTSKTTQYFLDGKLVRQDVAIEVDVLVFGGALAGGHGKVT